MKKTTIAVLFGGPSSEYSVSLESASAVLRNLDSQKYTPVPVGITQEGNWYYYTGELDKIRDDEWQDEKVCIPVAFSPNRDDHALLLFQKNSVEKLPVDAVFPVLHGRGGEDGTVQGIIEMAGIPLVGCGVLASALCMDKDRAHKLAQAAGIDVPKSCTVSNARSIEELYRFGQSVGYPLFVKPVKAGSSYGVSRVQSASELLPAVKLAFQYDNEIIAEESIDGFEVGCAVMGNEELTVGEIDEIELLGGFFDFTEKYTLKTSAIHVPARTDRETANRVKETAKRLYKIFGCRGFARVDLFLTSEGRLVFNEINTIPGFTEHSRFPGMMQAAGISFAEILDTVIRLAVGL